MSLLSTLTVAATVAAVVVAGASAEAAEQPKLLVRRAAPRAKVALPRGPAITTNTDASWAEFKRRYGRTYASAEEEAERRAHFARNLRDAARHQAQNPHAVFGATRFGDWSEAELRSMRPALPAHAAEEFRAAEAKQAKSGKVPRLSSAMEKKVDWREKGAVTPVKNQGQCGDCWSFSTTGNIEGQWKLAGHDLVSLSEQELTSCDTNDDGCNGGLPWNAMAWLIDTRNGWITSEKEYPFESASGIAPQCHMEGKPDAARIQSVHRLAAGDEKGLAEYLAEHGPVSIAVTAETWQTYEGGIVTSCGNGQIDHAVLAVGYDMDHSPPYWIVKNSWTTQWGEEGYIRLAYGSDMCQISQMASSAIVA